MLFLSTPSARRATPESDKIYVILSISIHALREEGDPVSFLPACLMGYFYPRPPRGGRHNSLNGWATDIKFLSTPSARRATCAACASICRRGNFYPRPPRGGRRVAADAPLALLEFLSTPSARRATKYMRESMGKGVFLSTPSARRATCGSMVLSSTILDFYPRPPRGGRPQRSVCRRAGVLISIHALREEGDAARCCAFVNASDFYPRPPRGGRHDLFHSPGFVYEFLSTPSARRATHGADD